MIRKVLIANRGEIAVRITRSLHEMGIRAVAVYSDADRGSFHVRAADEAYPIGPAPAGQSYLRIEGLLDAARRSGADAVHPGYGFLSESCEFAEAVDRAGLTFIGPPAAAMAAMGSKIQARARMKEAGVPITPGGDASTIEEARHTAATVGYPVLIKAAFGGGGKGMRMVHREADLAAAVERARSEAGRAFGDATVYIEKAIVRPRHVEIQVLGDRHGNMIHLFERDCSVQRRHQKVVEETPCPVATPQMVRRMGEVAVRGAKAVGYFSAGTFEFLVAEDGAFYFLEMNTRLQVEHAITELCTGVDIVAEMVRVASGEKLRHGDATSADLPAGVEPLSRRGAAIECRVYAEDPASGFLPSPGRITALRSPGGPWVRDDAGYAGGDVVPSHYDPLLSKLTVWAPDRPSAIARMRRALSEYVVTGIRTNLAFHEKLLAHPEFVAGRYHTGFIAEHAADLLGQPRIGDRGVDPASHAGPPSIDRETLAAALALAASRMDHAARPVTSDSFDSAAATSPWLEQHRARLRR